MTKRITWDELDKALADPANDSLAYIFTLDSHDAYGPFVSFAEARYFARGRNLSSYQLMASKRNKP